VREKAHLYKYNEEVILLQRKFTSETMNDILLYQGIKNRL